MEVFQNTYILHDSNNSTDVLFGCGVSKKLKGSFCRTTVPQKYFMNHDDGQQKNGAYERLVPQNENANIDYYKHIKRLNKKWVHL